MKTDPLMVAALKMWCWIFGVIGAVLLAVYLVVLRPINQLDWEFDHLEKSAQKAISASELQAWATNLLAHPVHTGFATDERLKTNFPRKLLEVFRVPPTVFIYDDTNIASAKVEIVWGGAISGECGFEIGFTNFVNPTGENLHKWQDGVYFWSEHPQK